MNSPQNRRRFLAMLGLGTATLAGCMDALGSADSDENDGEPSGNETDEDENGSGNEDGNGNREIVAPAIEAGELVDDFEEIEWNPMYDHTTVSSDDECLVGESSMLVESESRDVAGVFRAFSEGQDFFGKDLSFAVRVESPLPARVVLDVRAPGASDRLVSARSIPGEFDGWLRVEGGYTGKRGEPNLGNVQELRIYVEPRGDAEGPIRFRIDDLRATERSDQGKVILTFDDSVESQYTTALPMLEERGWSGVAAIIPDSLNQPGRLTINQCRKLRDAGWDVSAHPHTALPEMDSDERVEYLQNAHDYIANRISEDGARHYFAPYNRMDAASIADVREVFETSFTFGGQPNIAPPLDGHMLPRVNGHDADDIATLLDLTAEYCQVLTLMVHGVGDTESENSLNDVTEEDFEAVLDAIESRDLEVVTVSDLVDD
ncbi:polysaccharide deacetylase family protein [Halalkalicoccus salilacus]|uniref:polysaccharide deacetylase family protein n=1 Tax=Halalkalicoccus salilacus TaxID=3117459 RepID=UPI00300EB1D1